MNDTELARMLSRVRAGDTEAWGELYRVHAPAIFRFCRRALPIREDAEDATTEIFVNVRERLSSYDASRPFRAWLYAVASNHCWDQLRRRLVSGIAHELNNPLTAIMGYAQLLLGHGLLPAQLAEASMIYEEAERARRIVKNLLYFARENSPERTPVDINDLVSRTVALRSYELKMENIAAQCELAPGLPKTMADPYQLQQVILNLLVNAEHALLEASGQGNIWIRTAFKRRNGEDWITLEIADDGPGKPKEISSRIFDPFFTTKPAGKGTGLGLSIVYGIIQQHRGEISFESQTAQGTKFVIELPVVAPLREHSVAKSPVEQPPAAIAGRILVVEDEPTVGRLVADVLREEGHQVESVLDSQEGLTRLSRNDYDLVICDLRMPRLDGYGFYDALVRSGSLVQNRIVFITGDVLASRTLDFLSSRRLPYLAKPFLVEELKLVVKQALASADGTRSAGDLGQENSD